MFKYLNILFLLVLLSSCASGYVEPVGIFYSEVTLNKEIKPPASIGSRYGEACATSIMGVYASGDASIRTAAASGGIRMIMAVDYKKTSIMWIGYQKICTIVYGE